MSADYVGEALQHFERATRSTSTHGGHLLAQTDAMVGIGHALLAVVEVLKPHPDAYGVHTFEVAKPELPKAVVIHVVAEFERLKPWVGRSVRVVGHPDLNGKLGYLASMTKHDTYVLAVVNLQHEAEPTAIVSTYLQPVY
jgi:hypothetical protein